MTKLAEEGVRGTGSVGRLAGCVRIAYTNWRGEHSIRRIVPRRLFLGDVEWHPGTQWILEAWDVDKQAIRSFAMKDVHEWAPEDSGTRESSG